MTDQKKRNPILLLGALVPVIFLLLSLWAFLTREKVFFPGKEIHPELYSRLQNKMNLKIHRSRMEQDVIILEYSQKQEKWDSKIGIAFLFPDYAVDMNKYSHLNLKLHSSLSQSLRIKVETRFNDLAGRALLGRTLCRHERELILEPGKEAYSMKLSTFTTPSWWFTNNNVTLQEEKNRKSHPVVYIRIEDNFHGLGTRSNRLEIRGLSLTRDNTLLFLFSGGVLFLYLLLRVVTAPREIHFSPGEKPAVSDEVISLITTGYTAPDISVKKIARQAGIEENKVKEIVKRKYNLSFKQLVNQIRLTEARRLLKDTDNPVKEITFTLGFTTISNFYKLFKEAESLSPNEYRKRHRF